MRNKLEGMRPKPVLNFIAEICQNFTNLIVFHHTSFTSTVDGIVQLFVRVFLISEECKNMYLFDCSQQKQRQPHQQRQQVSDRCS